MASSDTFLPDVQGVEVILGTYEEFILGYKLNVDKENRKYSLSMSFTNHSQTKSIRAVQVIGKYVAAGSADESINLINMNARVEHGSLQEQNGTITCLSEYEDSYLFSGCEDGTICIWKTGSWMCEKTLIAHTGGVVDISVHPSGKLALSVGKDKALKTWNLVKGRCGYVTNLKTVADKVKWSPEGTFYAVSLSNRVDVYNLQTAKVVYSIPVGVRISCISFIDESTIVLAGDKESVEIHDLRRGIKLTEFKCHKVRVKALKYVNKLKMLFTASNDGYVKVWRLKQSYDSPPTLLAEVDTTCRITCMDVWIKYKNSSDDEVEAEVVEDEIQDDIEDDSDDDDDDDEEDEILTDEEESKNSKSAKYQQETNVSIAKKKRKVEKPDKPNMSSVKSTKTDVKGTMHRKPKK